MPAATGTRLSMSDALRRAIPPGRLAEELERPGGEVRALDARADHLVGVAGRGLEGQLVGQRHRLDTDTSGCSPSARGAPTSSTG